MDGDKKEVKRVGITHFPYEEERSRQDKVPHPLAEPEPLARHGLAHQLDEPAEADGGPASKSAKGGKTRGSRAGLLSASRKVKERK